MANPSTAASEDLRNHLSTIITNALQQEGILPLQTAGGKFACEVAFNGLPPRWVNVAISVPKGSREGEPFDGRALAQEYVDAQAEKRETSVRREAESKEKQKARIAKDLAKAERLKAKQAELEGKAEE